MRRVSIQMPTRVSNVDESNSFNDIKSVNGDNGDNSVDAELKRRAIARKMIDNRVDKEMVHISPSEQTRCGLFSCFPRTFARRSQNGAVSRREASSMEQRVFGKAVKATPAETKLAEVIVQLQALIAEQESKVARARAQAFAAYKPGQDTQKNKEALQSLKRVKQMEKQMEGYQGQLVMVERQRDSLEEAQMQKKLVAALSQSAKLMKANGPLVKQAEQVADTAVEFFDQNEEIVNALSQVNDDGDDDDLLSELAEMVSSGDAFEALEASLDVQSNTNKMSTPATNSDPAFGTLSNSLPSAPINSTKAAKATKALERASLLATA